VSDPAADVTSTQTWGAVSDGRETGTWTYRRPPGDSEDAGAWTSKPVPGDDRQAPGDDRQAPGDVTRTGRADSRAQTGGHRPLPRRPTGVAGRQPPASIHSAPPDAGGAPGTQPGRTRGHGTGGHSTRARPRKRRRLSRGLLATGLALVVALSAGGAYAFYRSEHRSPSAAPSAASGAASTSLADPSPTPQASSSARTPPAGPWRYISTRAGDPKPLGVGELFPAKFSAGASYSRTVGHKSTHCAAAVVGAKLQHALRSAGCSQVLRASYLSARKKQMGTIGVLNLKTFKAAERAGKAAGSAQFIRPLDARHGPTHNLAKAAGLVEAEVKGHYLILVLADFTNLHAPKTKKQRKILEAFMSQLINKTANVSLTSRMVAGTP
jgi:hypothetical protein